MQQDQSLPAIPGVPSSMTVATNLAGEQPLTSTGGFIPHGNPHMAMGKIATGATSSTTMQGGASGVGSELPGVGVSGAGGGVVGEGSDQQILRHHELALQRLEELQSDMIGGERGGRPLTYMYMNPSNPAP